jgi:voltage-gated potassium channel
VTVTTAGYCDRFPTTPVGRTAATFVMVMGVGIIGSLASIMASMFVGSAAPASEAAAHDKSDQLDEKLDNLDAALVAPRDELAALRRLVEHLEDGRSAAVRP